MQLLSKDDISKNNVNTIEQFKTLAYLKKEFNADEVILCLVDRFTIKIVDKNNEVGYFRYDKQTNDVKFYEKNIKNKEMER